MRAMQAPAVSVGMSMHNAARTIEQALRTLHWQTFPDWELLLIDDGSTDDSVRRARALADERVRVIEHSDRRGLPARLNEAVNLARGKYFARMDADDIAYPNRLERQFTYLEAERGLDLLGTGMLVFGDDGNPVGLYPARTTHAAICARPFSGFYLAHPTWMGRSGWFRRWPYDATYSKAQDQALLLRAYSSSCYGGLPETLLGYRQERVSISKSLRGRWHFSRAIWQAAIREGRLAEGTLAIAMQAIKFGYDAFALSTHLDRFLLSHRARPLSASETERWHQVWARSLEAPAVSYG